jgi:hypothetical protein
MMQPCNILVMRSFKFKTLILLPYLRSKIDEIGKYTHRSIEIISDVQLTYVHQMLNINVLILQHKPLLHQNVSLVPMRSILLLNGMFIVVFKVAIQMMIFNGFYIPIWMPTTIFYFTVREKLHSLF